MASTGTGMATSRPDTCSTGSSPAGGSTSATPSTGTDPAGGVTSSSCRIPQQAVGLQAQRRQAQLLGLVLAQGRERDRAVVLHEVVPAGSQRGSTARVPRWARNAGRPDQPSASPGSTVSHQGVSNALWGDGGGRRGTQTVDVRRGEVAEVAAPVQDDGGPSAGRSTRIATSARRSSAYSPANEDVVALTPSSSRA